MAQMSRPSLSLSAVTYTPSLSPVHPVSDFVPSRVVWAQFLVVLGFLGAGLSFVGVGRCWGFFERCSGFRVVLVLAVVKVVVVMASLSLYVYYIV
jgi:hypothetical protein